MKQIFTPLLLVLFTLLPATILAHDFEVDGIYYNNINSNEAAVTYKGTSSTQYDDEYIGSVNIPATVTYGGTNYSVTTIGSAAFSNCSGLTSITIPNSVKIIEWAAFDHCGGLTSVTIGKSVTTIDEHAFYRCSGLTSVTIPNSVITIGEGAFLYCSGLIRISVENGNPNYDSRNNCNAIIKTSSNTLITGCMNTTIPYSVTTIGRSAFYGCSGLTSVTIPNSVTTIGEFAFSNCSGLTSISVEDGNPNYDSRNNCNAIIKTSSNTIIAGCMNTTIPNSVTSIGKYAFTGCSGLTSITIPNSVTSIGEYAFSNCSELTSVTCLAIIPPDLSYLAFPNEVTNHATLYVPMESIWTYQTAYNWKDFSQIFGITLIDDFEVDGVWYRALDESTAMVISRSGEDEYYSGDVVIPEEVTYEGYTFAVISINTGAFEDCYDLSSVVIGDAVESIGENAFQGCTGLTSLTIGSGMTSIGAKAFNYCNALQTVTCRGTVPPVMASSNCFSTAAYNRAKLVVPRPEIDTYAATDYWYKFSHIEGWGYLGPGDVNGDGVVGMDDLTRLITILVTDDLGGTDPTWADVNGNGMVNMNDLTALINLLVFGHQ